MLMRGMQIVAGAGQTPCINSSTGNWSIGGIDTGVKARTESIEIKNKLIDSDDWVTDKNSNYFYAELSVPNVIPSDKIYIEITSELDISEYVEMYKKVKAFDICLVRAGNNKITIVSINKPDIDLSIDVTIMK